ncbi:MAG: GNAT family N-acetyltransferase [Candidatus Cloacimonadota bacterium]|nr:GNAT family N-acetyltransferase [Candidatus Cloacimonadota bacterium]
MELKKNITNSPESKEFIKQLQTNAKEKIVSFITKNNNIFIIKEKEIYIGFIHLNPTIYKISVKLYLSSNWKDGFFKQLVSNISKLIKNKNITYVSFLHCFDSKNILTKFKGIDFMHQYECNINYNELNPIINSDYTISSEINNFKKLIDFHKLCYFDDKEYMKSNWKKMLQSFPQVPFPTITYLCYNEDIIIGSCIGYYIPKKQKKYLYSICVHPNYRGESIGKYLLQLFLSAKPLVNCYLTVYDSANQAVKLYKKIGFKKIKTVESIMNKDDLKIRRLH